MGRWNGDRRIKEANQSETMAESGKACIYIIISQFSYKVKLGAWLLQMFFLLGGVDSFLLGGGQKSSEALSYHIQVGKLTCWQGIWGEWLTLPQFLVCHYGKITGV